DRPPRTTAPNLVLGVCMMYSASNIWQWPKRVNLECASFSNGVASGGQHGLAANQRRGRAGMSCRESGRHGTRIRRPQAGASRMEKSFEASLLRLCACGIAETGRRGARTRACRVENPLDASVRFRNVQPSVEKILTHEC